MKRLDGLTKEGQRGSLSFAATPTGQATAFFASTKEGAKVAQLWKGGGPATKELGGPAGESHCRSASSRPEMREGGGEARTLSVEKRSSFETLPLPPLEP